MNCFPSTDKLAYQEITMKQAGKLDPGSSENLLLVQTYLLTNKLDNESQIVFSFFLDTQLPVFLKLF